MIFDFSILKHMFDSNLTSDANEQTQTRYQSMRFWPQFKVLRLQGLTINTLHRNRIPHTDEFDSQSIYLIRPQVMLIWPNSISYANEEHRESNSTLTLRCWTSNTINHFDLTTTRFQLINMTNFESKFTDRKSKN